jgi:carbonic anhydrase
LLPDRYFTYAGSLTTPPCTEGVTWIVAAVPEELSSKQLQLLTTQLPNNARPTQPLGDRQVLLVAP